LVAQPAHGRAAERALPRGHEAHQRGDRRPPRFRSAGHEAVVARDRRVVPSIWGGRLRLRLAMEKEMDSAARRFTLLLFALVGYVVVTIAFVTGERPGRGIGAFYY